MTQLDLPQISFARYLDLLKRRRWQVVPVSLLGLIIGAVVAFFVPRYYVADTTIEFRGAALEPPGSTDPMAPLIESANTTIRYTLAKALQKLGWPEAIAGSAESRRAFEEEARKRIEVIDLNPRTGRRIAILKITYRDVDGVRAMEMTRTLRDLWLAEQTRVLTDAIDQKLSDVNGRVGVALLALNSAYDDCTAYENTKDINPQDYVGNREGILSMRTMELREVEQKLAALEGRKARVESELEAKRDLLTRTPPKIQETQEAQIPEPLAAAMQVLLFRLQRVTKQLADAKESHPSYPMWVKEKAEVEMQLATLQQVVGTSQEIERDNPEFLELRRAMDGLTADRQGAVTEMEHYAARRVALRKTLEFLPDVHREYLALLDQRARMQRDYDAVLQERREIEGRKRELTLTEPYQVLHDANVPPRPTEPNPTLLALAGSAVGLALAIGLILLLDVLQSTFKTVDDVERGLGLPVLGGISHMMTDVERRRIQAQRTRIGLIAGVFAVLMLSLVTIYYVAPTRLPPVVRDTLDLLLRSPTEAR